LLLKMEINFLLMLIFASSFPLGGPLASSHSTLGLS